MGLASLDQTFQFYFEQGLAPSTQRTYKAAIKRFYAFCVQHCLFNPFPLTEKLLCYFAVFLAKEGLTSQSIKTYLAAARNMHISLGFPDPRDSSSLPILRRIQLGIQRVQSTKESPSKRVRLPITPAILDRLRLLWEETKHTDRLSLWAAASLCFAGFFRAGELFPATNSPAAFSRCITWGDVLADSATVPSILKIHLRVSKCDQFGKGVDVFVGRTTNKRCPVVAVVSYMAARGDTAGPFFLTEDRKPITKSRFVTEVRTALTAIGFDHSSFSGHSFRSGAATAASQAGLPDSTIQTLGRWSSTAFLTYIRTPRQQLASLTDRFM